MKRIWVKGIVLFFLAAVMWWVVFKHHERRKAVVINTWAKLELQLLKNSTRTLTSWLGANPGLPENPEDLFQKELLPRLAGDIDSIREAVFFVLKDRRILFYGDPFFPSAHLGKTTDEILKSSPEAGTDRFKSLIDQATAGTDGAGRFFWQADTGRRVVAWTGARAGDSNWIMGLAVPETEIYRQYDPEGGLDWEMTWAVVITALLAGIVLSSFWREKRVVAMLGLLEETVRARTLELSSINDQLKMELNERQKVEEALRENEGRLRTLIETINEGLVVSDPDGVITYVNDRFAKITGHRREELVGRPAGYFLDEFSQKHLSDPGRGTDPEESGAYELGWIGKDGQQIIFLVSPRPILGPQGDYRGALAALTDITDLKRAENELRKSKEELEDQSRERTIQLQKLNRKLEKEIERRRAVESRVGLREKRLDLACRAARTGQWDWDPITDSLWMHPNLKRMLGYGEDELANDRRAWNSLLHPEDRPAAEQRMLSILDGGPSEYVSEHRMRHRDGSYRWFLAQGTAVKDQDGKIVRLTGFETDITERKIIEDGLKHSEEKYRTILRNMEDGYFEISLGNHFTFINQALCRKLGYGKSEMLGLDHCRFMNRDTANAVKSVYERVKRTGAPSKGVAYSMRKKDGTGLLMEASVALLKNRAGEAIGFQVLVRETSGHTAIREGMGSGLSFRTWFDQAPDPVFLIAADTGSIIEVNQAGLDLTGLSPDDLIGSEMTRLHPGTEEKRYKKIYNLESGVKDNPVSGEVITAQGIMAPVEINRTLVDMDGRPLLQVVFRDVSELTSVEAALEENVRAIEQSRQSTGRLLEDVGRELGAPVNRIIILFDRVLGTDLTAEQKECLIEARESGQRLLALVNDLLDHSRIEDGRFEQKNTEFQLEDCVFEVLFNLSGRAREKGLELAMRFRRGVPEFVVGDRSRLLRILANLLKNAVKFTDRGEVMVIVDVESKDPRDVRLNFAIKDTGIGLPLEKQKEIFSLFAGDRLQKPVTSEGTDLVLSTTARLVRIMGGKIWVVSDPGEGSTFHFTARFSPSEKKDAAFEPEELVDLRNRRVLVIDENKNTRNLYAETAADWGLTPIQAVSANQAMEQLDPKDTGTPIDLVIMNTSLTDTASVEGPVGPNVHSMPGDLPVILFTSEDRPQSGRTALGNRFYLPKPVKPTALVGTVKQALKPKPQAKELIRAFGSGQSH